MEFVIVFAVAFVVTFVTTYALIRDTKLFNNRKCPTCTRLWAECRKSWANASRVNYWDKFWKGKLE